jgi:hypothetical protein
MIRVIVIGVIAILVSSLHAHAVTRLDSQRTSCQVIQNTLIREGAAILRHQSPRGLPLHDRYVGDSALCPTGEAGAYASLPSRDGDCRVIACERYDPRDDGLFGHFPRPRLILGQ